MCRTRRHKVGLGPAVLHRPVARKENHVLRVVGVLPSHTATIGFGPRTFSLMPTVITFFAVPGIDTDGLLISPSFPDANKIDIL